MSGNANRSSQYLVELSRNRTNYAHKLEIERQKREEEDAIRKRTQNTDYSSELVESIREGSMIVYINGQIFLAAPTIGSEEIITRIPISWHTLFNFENINTTSLLPFNTNINENYFILSGLYMGSGSKIIFYNKDISSSIISNGNSTFNSIFICFLNKNGQTVNAYTFTGLSTSNIGLINSNTNDFLTRIATSQNRIYNSILYQNNTGNLVNNLNIVDISNTIIDTVKSSVLGSRFDSLLTAYNSNSDYLFNISLRTTDISDNRNTIFLPAVATFSNDDFVGSGYFRTNEIKAYLKKPGVAEQLLTTITAPVKISQQDTARTNADIYTISFDKNGNFRHYNYMRGTNLNPTGSSTDIDTYIFVDTNDNYYINGMYINQTYPNKLQFFNTSSTNIGNIVYETGNFIGATNSLNSDSYQTFIAKYDYNGVFQWFAPIYSSIADNQGDFTYLTKQMGNGIVTSIYWNSSATNNIFVYNAQTSAQSNTAGISFTGIARSNNFFTGDVNNCIVYYDSNGQVQWVKNITNRPLFGGSITQQISNLPIVVDSNNNLYGAASMLPDRSGFTTRLINWRSNSGTTQTIFTPDISGYSAALYSLNIAGDINWYGTITHDTSFNLTLSVGWIEKTSKNEIIYLVRHNCALVLRLYNSSATLIKTVNIPKTTNSSINTFSIIKIPQNITNNIEYIYCNNTTTLNISNHMKVDTNNDIYIRFENPTAAITNFNFINQDENIVLSYTDTLGSGTILKSSAIRLDSSFK